MYTHTGENEVNELKNGKSYNIELTLEEKNSKNKNIWKQILPSSKSDKEESQTAPPVPFHDLFRYATFCEKLCTIIGILCSFLMASGLPLLTIFYGEYMSLLLNRNSTSVSLLVWFGGGKKLGPNPTDEEVEDAILADAQAFGVSCALLSTFMFILGAISVYLLNYTAQKQIGRVRGKFFTAVIRQDMSWYDTNTNMNFASRITEDLDKMKEGIGEKIAIFTYLVSSFAISIVTSFVYGWELTLVSLSCAPLIIIATAVVSKMQSSLTVQELESYGFAGAVAEEVFGAIRTVVAFSGEQKEAERYSDMLVIATKKGQRKGFLSGIGGGVMILIIFCSYAVAFWYGIELILRDRVLDEPHYTPAVLVIVFFGVLTGAQSLGMTAPHLEAFAVARGSASTIFSVIERVPKIDAYSADGLKPEKITGNIVFENIYFQYPSRPDVKVLQGFNLTIKAGETVALVGSSGCGKSTIVQLLQRLYDPKDGNIYLDGNNIKSLNIKWLREHIGVVGQEPVLFSTTIGTNIRYGRMSATQDEIELAAKQANCHEFIKKLPNGYDTMITSAQLSGGQKQRIAIARALIREPMVLLLDEATSALDLQSEAKVQRTLDQARLGRTTLIVAHRLSTITNADRIVFINEGVVTEVGSHKELMERQGQYYHLVATEAAMTAKNKEEVQKEEKLKKLARIQSLTEKSTDGTDNNESSEIEVAEKAYPASVSRLLKTSRPEIAYLIVGCISSVTVGANFPAFAILFGTTMGILSWPDADEIRYYSMMLSILYILVGIIAGIATFLQTYCFNIAGVRLTTRLRQMTFQSMIKQEIAWFDDTRNSVGALCSRLSGDASAVQGATGTCVGAVVQAIAILIIGISVGLWYSWKLGLVCLSVLPLVLYPTVLEQRTSERFAFKEKKAIEAATKIAVEAISSIRTVVSLCREEVFLKRYLDELENVNRALRSKTRLRGLIYAFGQSSPFFGYAICLWYGGYLHAKEELEVASIIKVSEALIFGAWMMGQALAFAPNFNAAKLSAGRIFRMLDRVPNIRSDPVSHVNDNLKCEGNILYKNVSFQYPTRQNFQVLNNLNLAVKAGQTVALVGFSGCGKSTIIQLLQRLYDPDNGNVFLDEFNIKTELSLPTLRKQLGIVSQEPVLFDRTISENIAYGDNSREIPMSEIVEAAKQANIHNFINSLPLGYNTRLGTKGTQLSGGQKQRIAIARALIRQPHILLLDEATSALDRESEKIVQEALDKAREGRTCITIAHRLVTIRNADLICVIDKGQVIESGTHEQLLAQGGVYYQLQNLTNEQT